MGVPTRPATHTLSPDSTRRFVQEFHLLFSEFTLKNNEQSHCSVYFSWYGEHPMNELEAELKQLIVESLQLEDIVADQIDSEAPLFGEGLGLDSIDALELAVALSKKYGVQLEADGPQNREVFASVRQLATYIAQHQSPPSSSASA